MREQRLVFGEDPELYDRARPGYSEAVVDDVLAYAGRLSAGPAAPGREAERTARALEIGAGTGKATVAFARRGVPVLAIEPDRAMADVAERNCASFPGVRIERSAFEDWPVEPGAFALVYSAQSWHWVRAGVRCDRAAAALEPGGSLALLWHRVRWEPRDRVRADLDTCYRRYAPELHGRQAGFPGLTPPRFEETARAEIESRPEFADVAMREHRWVDTVSAERFAALLETQSDHRLLALDVRQALLGAVREVVEAHGGRIAVPYATVLLLARRSA
jgi:SAM-dependent methyltransferase